MNTTSTDNMLHETGRVIGLDGDYAIVQTARQSTCNRCNLKQGCGSGVLAQWLGHRYTKLRVLNQQQAAIGDSVTLAVSAKALLTSACLVYLLPLLLLALFALLSQWLFPEAAEIIHVMSGGCGLIIGLWLAPHLAAGNAIHSPSMVVSATSEPIPAQSIRPVADSR